MNVLRKKQDKQRLLYYILLVIGCILISRGMLFMLYKLCDRLFQLDVTFFQSLKQWDSDWYQAIIESGYSLEPSGHENGDAANWAFFPLMPLIIRGIVKITQLDSMVVAFFFNTILLTIGLIIMGKYIWITNIDYPEKYRREIVCFFVIFMTFGMYSFYFSTLYTESLYFCLLSMSLYHLEKENYICMGISGALLSATRNVGILFCFVVLIHCIKKYKQTEKEEKGIFDFFVQTLKNHKLVFGTSLIPMGLFLYMVYLQQHMGDGLAWMRIQRAWGRSFGNPLYNLIARMYTMERPEFFISVLTFICLYLIGLMIYRRKHTEAVLGTMNLLLPLCTAIASLPRYEIGNIVFVLAFCRELPRVNKCLKVFIILGICLIECTLFFDWMQRKVYVI